MIYIFFFFLNSNYFCNILSFVLIFLIEFDFFAPPPPSQKINKIELIFFWEDREISEIFLFIRLFINTVIINWYQ